MLTNRLPRKKPDRLVYTIGHSTRLSSELLDLLQENDVELIVDVRRYPGSRRHPQFSAAALESTLRQAGLGYRHEPGLGGRRSGADDGPNAGLRNRGFRAYADHMGSASFQEALGRILELADGGRPAVMCAEAVPWRCHRWLLSDALLARGAEVHHILGPGDVRPHTLHPAALVEHGRVRYPPPRRRQGSLFSPEG